jgi:glycosyltransferase involved in cell wall biosynthesis
MGINHQYPITVLLPVYNGEKHLDEAIDSVLSQSYSEFEFLIINDGSFDNTDNIIRKYAESDPRIRYIENEKNLGLVESLNRGLGLARGKYIARMDADDICHPERFQKQIDFMESHPEIAICGTSFQSFGSSNTTHIYPRDHEAIKAGLLFGSCICHPSVFMRTDFIKEYEINYLKETFPAEDYKIWVKAAKNGQLHNLPDILLQYREHETQISSENKQWQKEQTDKIRIEMLEWLYPGFKDEEIKYHLDVFVPSRISSREDVKTFKTWMNRLIESNNTEGNFNGSYLNKKLKTHLKTAILRWAHTQYFGDNEYSIQKCLLYFRSGPWLSISPRQNLKILLKSIFFKSI